MHWPVMEFAPVPGRPMFPVINARLMIACAVRVASWLWFTPMVHQNETRLPCRMVFASLQISSLDSPVAALTASGVNGLTN